ncbi:hypothetical protein MLD38_018823 [Melastoma candidum]|uniref:Uncharacterized protein n=1 Tax=Melastoma candidum TaxID=119954 RepID=A0ACB9QUY7_9MYRT|nr:hypothetical protein MLD38_018823 [Melastoma candidum]
MEEENALELLQRFRRDRRVLLGYLLSGSLIKKVTMPPGAVSLEDVDLDQVSVDYVLNCAKKGEVLELAEAIRDYHDSTAFPQMNSAGSSDEFFLVTSLESSGSPPRRAPPHPPPAVPSAPSFVSAPVLSAPSPIPDYPSSPVSSNPARSESFSSPQVQELTVDDIEDFEDDDEAEEVDSQRVRRSVNAITDLVPILPQFSTGTTDDDLRETAYEILLACAGASGGLIVPPKEQKKDKRSRLMKKLGRSKSENVVRESQRLPGLVGLLENMRVQMEISEAMDARTRKGLLNAMAGKVGKRMDALLIPLELLCCISRMEFSDKKSYIKWQKRQLNMLEEGLINHAAVGFSESGRKASELRVLLAKIEESESFPPSVGELQRTECLRSLREITIALAERPARGDLTGEVCHWADGYHLNIRLYEKLLLSVFDILDEGKLTEEVEEILELLKSTWRVLGITETMHYTCYAWILFRQHVMTNEQDMLKHALQQLKKIPVKEERGPQERLHLKSLDSRIELGDGFQDVFFLQSYLQPIQKWADKRLTDYHKHFTEDPRQMEHILKVAMICRRLLVEEPEYSSQFTTVTDEDQIELYVSSSMKNAFTRVLHIIDKTATGHEHPLASLAEESKRLLTKDSSTFAPVLSQWHPQAIVVSASLLHKLYGQNLKPFLEHSEHLTEDVASVFPAANSLELYITSVVSAACGEDTADFLKKRISSYQIESLSGTLVLRWVNSQLARILSWVERAIQQERWDPISPQLRHGNSIVEVYRIIEETVDQFFTMTVPMRSSELNSLFRGIDNAFQVYANHIVGDLATKEELIPPEPVLTRYKKEAGIKAFVKKELFDPKLTDERQSVEINLRTTSTLCVQLNSLHYGISQLSKLEDSIWKRWMRKSSQDQSMDEKGRKSTQKAFDGSRADMNAAIDRLSEFTGTKIVFWDLREPFIENLYKPSVSQSRLEALVEPLDTELNQLCQIIVEPLRDRVVTGLLQASLDGLLRVLLNGGPLRVFSPLDAKLLEEDLEVLKEFFISGGDGLPRGVVENQVARARQVIKLHYFESRELIDELRSVTGLDIQGGRSKLGADSNTLIRILCHRSDSEASQFLKKQYKLPKSSAIA